MMEVHPIRATLAIIIVLSAIVMMFMEYDIHEAWWAIVGAAALFYLKDGINK